MRNAFDTCVCLYLCFCLGSYEEAIKTRNAKESMAPTPQQIKKCDDYKKSGQYYPIPMIRIRNLYESDKPAQDTHPEHFTDCQKDFTTFKHTTGKLFFFWLG